jgi:hypothetical protein
VSNSEATGDATPRTEARPGGCLAHRTIFLVLHVAVDVQSLVELGKRYPWPRPSRCLSCSSSRLWGHGYVLRYFEGFVRPLWIRRLRCPDCHTVYTLRPDLFPRRFRYSLVTILSSLMSRITDHRWLPVLPRQNQQYWFTGLRTQSMRVKNILSPDTVTLNEIILSGFIPASHSFDCAMLRL